MTDSAQRVVIAIDGPAASGKSSVARALAQRLGYAYVNTGAMYRAVTWRVVTSGVDPADAAAVAAALSRMKVEFAIEHAELVIRVDGVDPSPHLSDPVVTHNVSAVSGIPEVRRRLTERQRAFCDEGDLVMEGRDIGSAVFPDTPHKFYIDASPDIRAQRRLRQGLADDLKTRDHRDSSRRASPLVIADDAEVIDSSHLTIDGVVGEIIGRLKLHGLPVRGDAGF